MLIEVLMKEYLVKVYMVIEEVCKKYKTKRLINGVTTQAKSLIGAAITTAALKNPVIMTLALTNVVIGGINAIQNQNMQRRQFEERRSAEMYEANRRRERINVGVYNRR